MRYCTQCGAHNDDNAKFCSECGVRLTGATQNESGSGRVGDVLIGLAAGIGARRIITNVILIGLMVVMLIICLVVALIVNATGYDGGATEAATAIIRIM